jgi:pimeloyl-ACP methyl ester carboxylesterase
MSARQIVALGSAAFGALVALNGALSNSSPQTKTSMPGDARLFPSSKGSLHYVVDGRGAPIVLVHGIGVAASSFEYRYIVEPLARSHTVFAVDLLGFGLSDHPNLAFSAAMFVKLLSDFLLSEVREPSVLIATGLSALYCVELAANNPNLVSDLVMSSPALPSGKPDLPPVVRQATDTLLATPVLGQSLFHIMTARNAIRSYLREHAYSNPDLVTESMVDSQYAMAHQPNARLAPQAYLAGRLTTDVSKALANVRQRILLVVGADARPAPKQCVAEYVRLASQTEVAVVDRCGALPHEEQPEQFTKVVLSWLGTQGSNPLEHQ